MMSNIRKHFKVPAKRGARVVYTSRTDGEEMEGVITGSRGYRLRVRLGRNRDSFIMHPVRRLKYL